MAVACVAAIASAAQSQIPDDSPVQAALQRAETAVSHIESIHDRQRTFDNTIAALDDVATLDMGLFTLTGEDGSESAAVRGFQVSSNLFSVLGVGPDLGRAFVPEEGQVGRDGVAIEGLGVFETARLMVFEGTRKKVGFGHSPPPTPRAGASGGRGRDWRGAARSEAAGS